MDTNDDNSPAAFWVEIDTGPIDNFTVPIDVAAGQFARGLEEVSGFAAISVAGNDLERSVAVRLIVTAADAMGALNGAITAMERIGRERRIGAVSVTHLRVVPEDDVRTPAPPPRVEEDEVTAVAAVAEPAEELEAGASLGHVAAPSHEVPGAGRRLAADPVIRAFSLAGDLARELRAAGGGDAARGLERWLAPGVDREDAIRGLRNELANIRAMSMPLWEMPLEHRIQAVLAAVSAIETD